MRRLIDLVEDRPLTGIEIAQAAGFAACLEIPATTLAATAAMAAADHLRHGHDIGGAHGKMGI
jgi:hypothetical protein